MALWYFAWLISIYDRKVKKESSRRHEGTKKITIENTFVFSYFHTFVISLLS